MYVQEVISHETPVNTKLIEIKRPLNFTWSSSLQSSLPFLI